MKNKEKIETTCVWKKVPDNHDYPAAQDYLELLFDEKKAKKIVDKLKKAEMTSKKAKDILRASRLPVLGKDNIHVADNIDKFKKGEKLSPVLLVRTTNGLIIADGYHRISAIYCGVSEDFNIPCKIVSDN